MKSREEERQPNQEGRRLSCRGSVLGTELTVQEGLQIFICERGEDDGVFAQIFVGADDADDVGMSAHHAHGVDFVLDHLEAFLSEPVVWEFEDLLGVCAAAGGGAFAADFVYDAVGAASEVV